MKKLYLILLLLCIISGGLLANPHRGIHNNPKGSLWDMPPCDTPKVNADSLLLQYLSHQPLSATGGTPPYTYNFSPDVTPSELIDPPDTNITYTITVTGANGCSSTCYVHYIALKNISSGSCTTLFLSEYIQDTVNQDDAVELYNPSPVAVNLNSYYLVGTTNMSLLTPFLIALHGAMAPHSTFLIANAHADTSLTHKAGMLSDSLNFRGLDIVALAQINISAPNITFSFLDEIGTISPLPTDSGWAVGSGSTKNHTLVRQLSVTQGSVNWSVCRTEWNVYARGNFSHIGTYSNVCTPEDAILYLTLANDSVSCGDPSYYDFDVLISADSAKILGDVTFKLDYPSNISAATTVSLGPHFAADSSLDDYSVSRTETSNSLTLELLSNVDTQQVVVNSVPQVLFHVKMKIANACQTGDIKFNPGMFLCHYVDEDSTFSHMENVRDSFSVVIDSCDPCSVCDSLCCTWDSMGNCITYCYITKDTAICHDTTWYYRLDSAYSHSHYHTVAYSNIIYNDTIPLLTCPPVIEPLDPVNAGTNDVSDPPNSSILTINGANFGNEKGQIDVPNANTGGAGFVKLDSMDILSWTNSQIVVKMPSVVFSNNLITPGSGVIQLFSGCGDYASTELIINYNIIGKALLGEKLRYNMAMGSDSNSIVFRCDTSISNYPRIYADVLQAIETWNCYTGIHWKMGDDTMLENIAQDGISVIYFSPTALPPGVLMETATYIDTTCSDMGDSMAYVHEADIAIDRGKFLSGGYSWNYDVSDTLFAGLYYYFYDVLLHELGHAHLLNHIDDPTSVMYYSFNAYQRKNLLTGTYPGPQTLYGGLDVVNTSAANTPSCSNHHILIPSPRTCTDPTLAVGTVLGNQYNLNLYPNPVGNQELTISYELTQNSYIQFKIIDYTGREVMKLSDEQKLPGGYKEQINTDAFANGIYLFVANINGSIQTIKFIKL